MLNVKILVVQVMILLISHSLVMPAVAKAKETGTIQIFSEEEDVYIYLDGYMKGKNSVIKDGIQVGDHYVKATKGKKDGPAIFTSVVRVNKGEVETVVIPANLPSTTTLPATTTTILFNPRLSMTAEAVTASASQAATSSPAATAETGPKLRADLPVKVIEITASMVKEKNLDVIDGLYVNSSSLEALKPGDIIVTISSIEVKSFDIYHKFIDTVKVGDRVSLEVVRQNKNRDKIEVELIAAPSKEAVVIVPAKTETPSVEAPKVEPPRNRWF